MMKWEGTLSHYECSRYISGGNDDFQLRVEEKVVTFTFHSD